MTAKKMIRTWLQNCYKDKPDKHELAFMKSYMPRLFNDTKLEVGKPKATAIYTAKELEMRGLVGLYGYRFVRPIENYKRYGRLSRMAKEDALRNLH